MAWTAPRTWTDGELVTAAIMNPHVRDNFLATGPHLIVRKTSDETVTSSTVFQDDNVLILPVGINEVWQFWFNLLFTADTAGDLKTQYTFPSGGAFSAVSSFVDAANAASNDIIRATTSPTNTAVYGSQSATVPQFIGIQGVYVNGGTGGSVTLQWAQNTSSATATTIKTNSTLWAVKLA